MEKLKRYEASLSRGVYFYDAHDVLASATIAIEKGHPDQNFEFSKGGQYGNTVA